MNCIATYVVYVKACNFQMYILGPVWVITTAVHAHRFYKMFLALILNKKDTKPMHISNILSSIYVFLLASYNPACYNWEQLQHKKENKK